MKSPGPRRIAAWTSGLVMESTTDGPDKEHRSSQLNQSHRWTNISGLTARKTARVMDVLALVDTNPKQVSNSSGLSARDLGVNPLVNGCDHQCRSPESNSVGPWMFGPKS